MNEPFPEEWAFSPAQLPSQWTRWVAEFHARGGDLGPRWQQVWYHTPSYFNRPHHLTAEAQEELIGMLPSVAQEMAMEINRMLNVR